MGGVLCRANYKDNSFKTVIGIGLNLDNSVSSMLELKWNSKMIPSRPQFAWTTSYASMRTISYSWTMKRAVQRALVRWRMLYDKCCPVHTASYSSLQAVTREELMSRILGMSTKKVTVRYIQTTLYRAFRNSSYISWKRRFSCHKGNMWNFPAVDWLSDSCHFQSEYLQHWLHSGASISVIDHNGSIALVTVTGLSDSGLLLAGM